MLAYVFWHRPFTDIDRNRYEDSLLSFQAQLGRQKPPGFIAAVAFRIEAVPWLNDQPGYEDWYFVQGSWALDPLNGFAVTGALQRPHDTIAAQMDQGHGGLYADAGGDSAPTEQSSVYWLTRPRGIDWRTALQPVRAHCPQAHVWRRQMVLGSAAEFAVEAPGDTEIAVPSGWQCRRVRRARLGPASGDGC